MGDCAKIEFELDLCTGMLGVSCSSLVESEITYASLLQKPSGQYRAHTSHCGMLYNGAE